MDNRIDQEEIKNSRISTFSLILLFFIILIFGMNYFIPNYGGEGLSLPQNTMVWFGILLLSSLAVVKSILSTTIVYSKIQLSLLLVLSLIFSLGLINYNNETETLFTQSLGLLGFFMLFWSFEQFSPSKKQIIIFLYIICLSVLIQIIYGVFQKQFDLVPFKYVFDKKDMVVGVFQQRNVYSSFLATGIVISFYLIVESNHKILGKLLKIPLYLIPFGAGWGIVEVGSRAGLVGGILGFSLIALVSFKNKEGKKYILIWLLLMSLGGVSSTQGSGVFSRFLLADNQTISNIKQSKLLKEETIIKSKNNIIETSVQNPFNQRLIIWKLSLSAFMNQPWLGYGLGNFHTAYVAEKLEYNRSHPENKDIQPLTLHPHNEILYWAVQSGIIAVVAIFYFIIYYLKIVISSQGWRKGLIYIALLLPIGFHTLVSYPFYLSTIHLFVFVFLLYIGIKDVHKNKFTFRLPIFIKYAVISLVVVFSIYSFYPLKMHLNNIYFMTRFKVLESKNIKILDQPVKNIYFKNEALIYINYEKLKIAAKKRDIISSNKYIEWFEMQLKYNETPMIYSRLIISKWFLGHKQESLLLLNDAIIKYPENKSLLKIKKKLIR